MEREQAIDRLPAAYRQMLAQLDQGATVEDIAIELGVDPLAVGPLIRLAEAKLTRLAVQGRSDRPRPERPVTGGQP